MFKSLELEVDRPYTVNLVKPNGTPLVDTDGKQAWIKLLSLDSQRAQQWRSETAERRADKGIRPTRAMMVEDGVEVLAHVTLDWYLVGFDGKPAVDDGGRELRFSESVAKQLYSMPSTEWITEQVRIGATLRENFMPMLSGT